MKFKPHQYQEHAIKHIIDTHAAGLFLDMGMGKTVSTLTAVSDLLYDYFDVSNVLVIAPLRVAEDTWSRESEKWDHTSYLKVSKVLGPESSRIMALDTKADIYVINRENVEWLVNFYGKKWPFDMVVIDELSSFKSSKAKRFRALKKVRPFIKRIVGLTGTPAPNSLIDLWPQMYLLDQGERLGKTVTSYREKYFQPDQRNRTVIYSWKLKEGAEKAIHEKVSDICISMQARDWLQLPERIDNIVKVRMADKVKAKYKQLEKDLLLPFLDGDVVADTAAVLSNKLLQLANGAVYDENGEIQKLHDEKLNALEDIVDAANGKPILVFYSYKHDLERIRQKFKKAKTLDSSKEIADWNNGKIEMLLAHPASTGHGLNLQDGGHVIVWFGMTWSLELYQQANARLDRQGQKHSVIVNHLVTEGTVDEDVMRALEGKAVGQNALMEAVKARLEKLA
ncbi:DEAD/DEAH box helicase [Bacillus velezensis]|uniref:DEAD/DEAH box helicase n=1 Tax=Bacillus velezensis TaxID=492670 RepID=UPI000E5C511E|nr:DEAD/DEAH box helicase [Bacillus velezensis]AXY38659.1 DEAD/DEAH box helicase [Bacillus velezensis]MEC1370654.1 DEAD/DEAH box helicase [Bacillus velezensis]